MVAARRNPKRNSFSLDKRLEKMISREKGQKADCSSVRSLNFQSRRASSKGSEVGIKIYIFRSLRRRVHKA